MIQNMMTTDNTPNRMAASEREQQILDAALRIAETSGYAAITREGLAVAAGVAPALISHYFGSMDGLRHRIMQEAVRRQLLRIVAQGIVARHKVAMRAPRDLRSRALAACAPKGL